MRNEGNRPIVEATDDVVVIADALMNSLPANNRVQSIDEDTDRWNKSVYDGLEAMEDTFHIYREGESFLLDNESSWLTNPGDVTLHMPFDKFKKAIELYRGAESDDHDRGKRVSIILDGLDLI